MLVFRKLTTLITWKNCIILNALNSVRYLRNMKLNGIIDIMSIICVFRNSNALPSLSLNSKIRLMNSRKQTIKSKYAMNAISFGGRLKILIATIKIRSIVINIIKIMFLNCISFSLSVNSSGPI